LIAIGETAPNFENLRGTDGKSYSLSSFSEKPALVVIFSCNHCPYVQAYEDRMVSIQRDYAASGVQLVAINSNDERASPGDNYPEMVKRAKARGFNFPYLRDEDQKVVDAYGAVCTPHVFAFDAKRELRYRGRIDDSKDSSKVTSSDLRNALDEIIAGQKVEVADTKPFGCSIKWLQS
jgi:peroxiredoxin